MTKKVLLFAFVILSFSSIAQKAQRIGYIDMEYILENIPEYNEAQSKLNSKALTWQNNIEKSRSRGTQTQDQSQSSCEEARTISQSPHSQEGSRARSSYRRRTCVWR